jgi:hypothetical protein
VVTAAAAATAVGCARACERDKPIGGGGEEEDFFHVINVDSTRRVIFLCDRKPRDETKITQARTKTVHQKQY